MVELISGWPEAGGQMRECSLWSDLPPQASTSYRLCHSSVVLSVGSTATEDRAFNIGTSGEIQDKNHECLHDILQWARVHAQTLLLTKSVLTSAGQQEKPERGERWLWPSRWSVYPVRKNLWFLLFWFVLCFQYLALASLETWVPPSSSLHLQSVCPPPAQYI